MKLSIIIPVYNAEKTLETLISEIETVLRDVSHEIILINDGSKDSSEKICEKLSLSFSAVQYVSFRRNFSEHNAVMCGLNFAKGEYCAIIDDDLQNSPADIISLLTEAEKGFDVVYAHYKRKQHHMLRNLMSYFNGRVAELLIGKPRNLYLSSFKVIHHSLVKELIHYKGPFPYIDGLILRTTNNISKAEVPHNKRLHGKSNYTFSKLFSLYMNMFLNFSIKPIRLFTISGALIFMLSIGMTITFIIEKFVYGEPPGWTSTALLILLFSSFQIIFLGLIGEFIGKQYLDQNKTPQWVIKKTSYPKTDAS